MPLRSSLIWMRSPAFRNESSRRRCESTSKSNSMDGKICGSGWKVTSVPVLSVVPIASSALVGLAAAIGLAPDLAVAPDLELEPLGERVHHRDADAVQAARDLVGPVVELAAGVQRGHHDLGGGALLGRMLVDRDAAAVVGDGDAAVLVDDRRRSPCSSRRRPRRPSCRRPRRRGGAGPRDRWSRCTSRGACGPVRGPRAPRWHWRRSSPVRSLSATSDLTGGCGARSRAGRAGPSEWRRLRRRRRVPDA